MSLAPTLAMGATLLHVMGRTVCICSLWAPTRVQRVYTCVGAKPLRKHALCLPMCSTVAPMARRGARDIPGNGIAQGITSSSTNAHVQDASGALTGAVGSAADGTRRGSETP